MEESRFRAGIELHGRAMRYAEVEVVPDGMPRLARLGACDFDFDVAQALLALTGPTHLDTVATAVREIFDGSPARTLRVAVHPWNSTSFFSPIPEGMPPAVRLEQFRQEAAMLADASVTHPVRVKATPVRVETLPDERQAHWHHVLRLPDSIHARFDHVAAALSEEDGMEVSHAFVDATGGAAAVMGRVMREDDSPFALALGIYDGRTEYALCRGDVWHAGHYVDAGLDDSAYFGIALLDRLGVNRADVERLFVYGEGVASESASGIGDLLGLDPEPLDPLAVLRVARSAADPFVLAAYAPVIGTLLG